MAIPTTIDFRQSNFYSFPATLTRGMRNGDTLIFTERVRCVEGREFIEFEAANGDIVLVSYNRLVSANGSIAILRRGYTFGEFLNNIIAKKLFVYETGKRELTRPNGSRALVAVLAIDVL